MAKHSLVSLGARHPAHSYEYANTAARTGASGFASTDIGKLARQTDDNTYWVLTAITPTWTEITAAGGSDSDAIHDNVASEISAVTEKTTLVAADLLLIEDSADSNAKKRVQITNLPGKRDASIALIIDGGGSAISTGIKADVIVPFACTIVNVTLLADQSGSIVIDIWKDVYGSYPPTVADTITASAKPTITTAVKSQDSTLTGWTTAVAKEATLRFNVDSCTTIERVLVHLQMKKT